MTITVSGSSITFPDSTTQTTAGKSGTVTSVATGNGLQGGTITTSGTLSVACPSFNSVGSYVFGYISDLYPTGISAGGTCAAGSGYTQVQSYSLGDTGGGFGTNNNVNNNLSGTWRWMGASTSSGGNSGSVCCRVS